jgi:hypothetical protein
MVLDVLHSGQMANRLEHARQIFREHWSGQAHVPIACDN